MVASFVSSFGEFARPSRPEVRRGEVIGARGGRV
jgi:hypothetical protein